VVYDLRHDVERTKQPSVLPEAARSVVLAIGGESTENREIMERILDGELSEADDSFMAQMYVDMLRDGATTFGRVLSHLAEEEWLPALFHCTAGKDRTGMTAAILLSALGVDEATVLDDYELTERYWTAERVASLRPRFEAAGVDIERFGGLFGAPRSAMAATLSALHERHGTGERYLVEAGGMEPEALDELRRLLVQPA
jgi:protein-tyrosine phosphatase